MILLLWYILKFQFKAEAGAKIGGKVEPEPESKINNFGSATLDFGMIRLT